MLRKIHISNSLFKLILDFIKHFQAWITKISLGRVLDTGHDFMGFMQSASVYITFINPL